MPSRPSSEPAADCSAPLPRDLQQLRAALAAGCRSFPGLRLPDINGVDLDLSGCDLRDANLSGAHLHGADLSWAQLPATLP